MGPQDRVVVLIDMDCFYCQVEEKLDPSLEGKPIAVVQYNAWKGGGIIAVNYPARDEGVTRHMRGNEAREKCPSIKLVQVPELRGKADLTKYRDAGKRVADVLATFTPLLERASVDEAYLDITEVVNERLQNELNQLNVENMQNTFVVGSNTENFIENSKENREFCEANLKLAMGGLITEKIRKEIYDKTGYKCSAGIAHNKILAKLVCGLHKPNKQTILPQEGVEELFKTMPIRKVKGFGGKFGQTLSEDFGCTLMGELIKFSEKEFAKKYDEKTANWLYNIARGIELEPVTTKLISKSIGCCKNFPGRNALTTAENVKHWLEKLSEELSERLKQDLQENNRKAKQVIISFIQDINKKDVSSSRTHPLISYESKKIMQNAFDVLNKFCLRSDGSYHIKFMGFSASNFEEIKKVREITSFFKSKPTTSTVEDNKSDDNDDEENVFLQKTQELVENLESIQFYDDNFRIKNDKIENNEDKTSTTKVESSKTSSSFFLNYFKNLKEKTPVEKTETIPEPISEPVSFYEEPTEICPECQKNIKITELASHQDYHFALKLSKSENNTTPQQQTTLKQTLKTETKKNTQKSSNKRKKTTDSNKDENNKILMSFIQKNVGEEDLGDTEECPQCNKRIKIEEIESHLDYHTAKKLHLELNAVVKTPPISGTSSSGKSVGKKAGNKIKNNNNVKSVSSFFKPV